MTQEAILLHQNRELSEALKRPKAELEASEATNTALKKQSLIDQSKLSSVLRAWKALHAGMSLTSEELGIPPSTVELNHTTFLSKLVLAKSTEDTEDDEDENGHGEEHQTHALDAFEIELQRRLEWTMQVFSTILGKSSTPNVSIPHVSLWLFFVGCE